MAKRERSDVVNKDRRYFLIAATSIVGSIGLASAATPFVAAWSPSAPARARGAPIRINISKLKPGEMLGPIPGWRGMPVFVLYRTREALSALDSDEAELQDPNSERMQQPVYAKNVFRSRRPHIGVYLGVCTHLQCSPKYFGKVEPHDWNRNWKGGFFCMCHGSEYDLAGRVKKGVPAPANLEVPPYIFESDDVIVIGVDEEHA
jgi:ubiquinol-cytochrome c reductase iron-sulfur subunit